MKNDKYRILNPSTVKDQYNQDDDDNHNNDDQPNHDNKNIHNFEFKFHIHLLNNNKN